MGSLTRVRGYHGGAGFLFLGLVGTIAGCSVTRSGGADDLDSVSADGGTSSGGGQEEGGRNARGDGGVGGDDPEGAGSTHSGGSGNDGVGGGSDGSGASEGDGGSANTGSATGSGGGESTGGSGGGGSQGDHFPSCSGNQGDECGAGESCCETILVPEGQMYLGRSEDPMGADYFPGAEAFFVDKTKLDDEVPETKVFVSEFYLDKFEVTVGRFRKFVEAFDGTPPAAGAGAHPTAPDVTGWLPLWDDRVPEDADALRATLVCNANDEIHTWTDEPGDDEELPINCMNWFTAMQFCIWDGGRLPTEAEWEYVAAGGLENRLYPWGDEDPGCTRANLYFCNGFPEPVGSIRGGASALGHLDMAGNLLEWTMDGYEIDFYSTLADRDPDPLNTVDAMYRTLRGSWFYEGEEESRSARREGIDWNEREVGYGMRCARDSVDM